MSWFMLRLCGIYTYQHIKFSKFSFSCFWLSRAYWFMHKKWIFSQQIFLQIWSHLLKKFLMNNFIFCAVTSKDNLSRLVQYFCSNRLTYHNILVIVKHNDSKTRGSEIILKGDNLNLTSIYKTSTPHFWYN